MSTLTILSYNIWGLPWPFVTRPDRFPKIGRALVVREPPIDIVCLQEVFSADAIKAIRKTTSSTYPHRAWGAKASNIWLSSGLVILSRHPIVRQKKMIFQKATGFDRCANKGVQYARIQLAHTSVDVFNTHLESGDGESSQRARLSQIQQLIRFIKQHHRPSSTKMLFVVGDFNCQPDSLEYRSLVGLDSSLQNSVVGKRTVTLVDTEQTLPHPPTCFQQRLDFIFTSSKSKKNSKVFSFFDDQTKTKELSDHMAVCCEIEI